ncbi:MAG TPA: MBL fold metallo-hydrolase [Chthoniobacterales bacterium]|nr:MBL fold metallo-hydrolase [Chthoniobacterales bacterium]
MLVFSLTVLGSGSGGNCALVTSDRCRILIDAGFSARRISQRLQSLGIEPESLDGILLTHEHSDHIAGLKVFCGKFDVPVYCNSLTAEYLCREGIAEANRYKIFSTGSSFTIQDIDVQAFYVPHDAVDPVAFVLSSDYGSVGFLTDLGYAPKLARERIREVHTLVVETNHDEQRLQADSKRPWSVKQRILSRHGHLSNEAAAALVADIAGENLRRVILGHLSRECNSPELALGAMRRLSLDSLELHCAEQNQVSPQFEIGPLPVARPLRQNDWVTTGCSTVSEKINPVAGGHDNEQQAEYLLNLGWDVG